MATFAERHAVRHFVSKVWPINPPFNMVGVLVAGIPSAHLAGKLIPFENRPSPSAVSRRSQDCLPRARYPSSPVRIFVLGPARHLALLGACRKPSIVARLNRKLLSAVLARLTDSIRVFPLVCIVARHATEVLGVTLDVASKFLEFTTAIKTQYV